MLNYSELLLDALLQPLVILLLLRFHLLWLRAPMHNSFGRFLMTLTDFLVLPARRLFTPVRGIDIASLLLIFAAETLYFALSWMLHGKPFALPGLLVWSAVHLLRVSIYLLMGLLLARALLSWINPYSPISTLMIAATQPFLEPLQRRIPSLGGLDFSVLILFLICQFILAMPISWLESQAAALL
ncbi:MAG: YggT family protein [Gallionellaceae bacterium]|jgi:YggT family protein|nr:YggT family protein [Gallionellaceae bacterium]